MGHMASHKGMGWRLAEQSCRSLPRRGMLGETSNRLREARGRFCGCGGSEARRRHAPLRSQGSLEGVSSWSRQGRVDSKSETTTQGRSGRAAVCVWSFRRTALTRPCLDTPSRRATGCSCGLLWVGLGGRRPGVGWWLVCGGGAVAPAVGGGGRGSPPPTTARSPLLDSIKNTSHKFRNAGRLQKEREVGLWVRCL